MSCWCPVVKQVPDRNSAGWVDTPAIVNLDTVSGIINRHTHSLLVWNTTSPRCEWRVVSPSYSELCRLLDEAGETIE